jgi:acid phosphatase
MGPLLDDLQRKMQKKVDDGDKEQLKLLVYSTHDTALAGLLSSLDAFDHR